MQIVYITVIKFHNLIVKFGAALLELTVILGVFAFKQFVTFMLSDYAFDKNYYQKHILTNVI